MKHPLSYFCNLLPIKRRKIVFSNLNGLGFGCNPKYILLNFINDKDFDLVWISRQKLDDLPKNVRQVKWGSFRALFEWSTAEFIVNNTRMGGYFTKGFKKKPKQKYIQTWHGSFGIKKMEKDAGILDERYVKKAKKDSENIDLLVSNSSWLTRKFEKSFWYSGPILEVGSPRNDIFFHDCEKIKKKVFQKLALKECKKVALYVPTFRDSQKEYVPTLNTKNVTDALSRRFGGDWCFIQRSHSATPKMRIDNNVVDASDYGDVQELLVAADCVISDYSSVMFDFCETGKPVFLFVPDLQNYELSRGLYYPLEQTPFPLAKSEIDLLRMIEEFDISLYEKMLKQFLVSFGIADNGFASQKVGDWMRSNS